MPRISPDELRRASKDTIDARRRAVAREVKVGPKTRVGAPSVGLRRTDKRDTVWADLIVAAASGQQFIRFISPDRSTLDFLRALGLVSVPVEKSGNSQKVQDKPLTVSEQRHMEKKEIESRLWDARSCGYETYALVDFDSSVRRKMPRELVSWLDMHNSSPYTDIFGRYFMRDFSYRGGHSRDELIEIQKVALREQRKAVDQPIRVAIRDLIARIDRVLEQTDFRLHRLARSHAKADEGECTRAVEGSQINSQRVLLEDVYDVFFDQIHINDFDDEYDLRWIQWLWGSEGQKFLTKIEQQLKKAASSGDTFEIFEVSERTGYPSSTRVDTPWKPYAYFCDGGELISAGAEPEYFCYIMELLGYKATSRLRKKIQVVTVRWF